MTLIGMKLHLAVGQRANRLAVLANVRDQHDRGVGANVFPGVDHRRRTKALGEADLILLGELLVPQQDHEVLVPGGENLLEGLIVEARAQIHSRDFGPQGRR